MSIINRSKNKSLEIQKLKSFEQTSQFFSVSLRSILFSNCQLAMFSYFTLYFIELLIVLFSLMLAKLIFTSVYSFQLHVQLLSEIKHRGDLICDGKCTCNRKPDFFL